MREMYVWCNNFESDNYAKELVELHFQQAILPSRLMVSLIQNRSVNSIAESNTNNPVDLCQEHEKSRKKQDNKENTPSEKGIEVTYM